MPRLLVTLCALAVVACGGAGVGAGAAASVRVVLVDAFTGAATADGSAVQNSLQVEIDALNAGGGLLGRPVELVAADDELAPGKAAALVSEYLAGERVGLLVGPSATDTYAAARPAIDRAGVPNCLPDPVADGAVVGAPYSFRTRPADATAASVLLGHLQRRTRIRRLGVLAATDADARAADALLGGLASGYGIAYAGSVSLDSAPDVATAVQQLAGRGVQGVVLSDAAAAGGAEARALRALGLQAGMPAFGLDGLAVLAYADQAGDAAAGTTVVAPPQGVLTAVPPVRWPAAYEGFVRRVAAGYGYAPNGVEIKGLPAAGDCVALWARAVRRAGSFDGRRVVSAWEGLRVAAGEAVLGVPERFGPGRHDAVAADGLFVYQWATEGAQFRLQQLAS